MPTLPLKSYKQDINTPKIQRNRSGLCRTIVAVDERFIVSKAFYRKYRSKRLSEVVGQSHITDILERALKNDKIAHAYLFSGPRGVGKTSIARILAHEINGITYKNDEPHIDIIEIDAASNNGVDDIRDLREKIQLAPVSARKKIYIIDEVHMLSKAAFNALLKTLEEPPEHAVFILATTDADKLPDTIISRTQRFIFRTISSQEVADHLGWIAKQEGLQASKEALRLIADYGGGSFRDSIGLLDQLHSTADKHDGITPQLVVDFLGIPPSETVEQLLLAYQSGSLGEIIKILDQAEQAGSQPIVVANELIRSIKSRLAKKPQLVTLMDRLLDVAESSRPDIKLLVALAPGEIKATKSVALSSTKATSPMTINSPDLKEDSFTAEIKKNASRSQAKTAFDWDKLLSHIKANHVAISTVLMKCSHRIDGDTLTIYTGSSFYKNKLDNPRYRSTIAASMDELGMPELTVTTISSKAPPEDAIVASVATIMGGGEEVSLEDGSKD